MAGMVDHKGKAEISFRNQEKRLEREVQKEKASYSEMQNLLSSHFICSGYHDARYWMLQWVSRHVFLLYFSFHPRNGWFLKTGTSGFSGKLLVFYHAFLCFHAGNSLIPRHGNARWLHSLLHQPTAELLQIPAYVYVDHPHPTVNLCAVPHACELLLGEGQEFTKSKGSQVGAARGSVLKSPA